MAPRELHARAMHLTDEALAHRQRGDHGACVAARRQALELELRAATLAMERGLVEFGALVGAGAVFLAHELGDTQALDRARALVHRR